MLVYPKEERKASNPFLDITRQGAPLNLDNGLVDQYQRHVGIARTCPQSPLPPGQCPIDNRTENVNHEGLE